MNGARERRQGRVDHSRRALIERDDELHLIERQLADARAGIGSATLIDAPAGRGKSRLLHAAGDAARDEGMRVLGGYSSELERAFSFGLAIQLFEPLWMAASDSARDRLIEGPARRARQLLDGAVGAPPAGASDQAYSIIHGLFWLACNLSAVPATPGGAGTVMLVEDAHWADALSWRFLAYLAQRIHDIPVALIVTLRAGENPVERAALAALRSAPATTTVHPRALSDGGVRQIVNAALPHSDDQFSSACAQATGGNPFLLMELLEQVRADGATPDALLAGTLVERPPESVLASVLDRLSPLPDAARRVISSLAILGDGATLQQAAALADLDVETTSRAADLLATTHFVHPGTPLTFVHPLIRSAVRRSIAPIDRGQAHRRAAEVLRAEEAPAELVAAHLLASPPRSDPEAIEVLRDAARNALAKGDADTAVRVLERALAEQPAEGLYPELLSELAGAEVAAGSPHAVDRLESAMEATDEKPKRLRLALVQGRALHESGRHAEAAEALQAAITERDPADLELSDELEAAWIAAASEVPELATEAHDRADAMRRRTGMEPTRGEREALARMAMRAALRGAPRSEVSELAQRAWDDGALLGVEGTAERVLLHVTGALFIADELEADIAICEATLASAAEMASPAAYAAAAYSRAWPRYEQGQIADALLDAQAALDVRLDRWEVYARHAYAALACCHIQRGELDDAATALASIELPGVADSTQFPWLLEARAQLRLAEMRPVEALADATEAGRRLEARIGPSGPGAMAWRSTAALAHLALGAPSDAYALAAEELDLARAGDVTRVIIRDLRIMGLARRGTARLDLLAEAVAAGEQAAPRLEYIHALADFGAALRRAKHRADAREPLKRSLDLAREGGATAAAERAHTELLASGARRARSMLHGVDALTPSQRRVANLAAQGLTTRMIAEALFITPKTVEFHLRQTYLKLEVKSRDELAAVLKPAGAPAVEPDHDPTDTAGDVAQA